LVESRISSGSPPWIIAEYTPVRDGIGNSDTVCTISSGSPRPCATSAAQSIAPRARFEPSVPTTM